MPLLLPLSSRTSVAKPALSEIERVEGLFAFQASSNQQHSPRWHASDIHLPNQDAERNFIAVQYRTLTMSPLDQLQKSVDLFEKIVTAAGVISGAMGVILYVADWRKWASKDRWVLTAALVALAQSFVSIMFVVSSHDLREVQDVENASLKRDVQNAFKEEVRLRNDNVTLKQATQELEQQQGVHSARIETIEVRQHDRRFPASSLIIRAFAKCGITHISLLSRSGDLESKTFSTELKTVLEKSGMQVHYSNGWDTDLIGIYIFVADMPSPKSQALKAAIQQAGFKVRIIRSPVLATTFSDVEPAIAISIGVGKKE